MIAFALHPGASFTVADQIVNSVQRLDLVVVFILQSHRLQIKWTAIHSSYLVFSLNLNNQSNHLLALNSTNNELNVQNINIY